MHSTAQRLLVLLTLCLAAPAAAQQPLAPGMKRGDDVVVESKTDGGRGKAVSATGSATGSQTETSAAEGDPASDEGLPPPPSQFLPLSGLGNKTVPGTFEAPAGDDDEDDAGTGGQETPQAGGGRPTSLRWMTLFVYKPSAPRLDLPSWWSLAAKQKGSKAIHSNKPKKGKAKAKSRKGRGKDKDKDDGDSGGGDLQAKIVKAAQGLVGKRFPYAPGTNGGRLGCANVVSAALRKAGAMKSIMLGVIAVNADLRKRGWKGVKPPPWKDGDVISWATYDRTGDGRNDADTHIGIISVEGGTVYAINNSSSRRVPVKVPLKSMGYPVTTVLRKA